MEDLQYIAVWGNTSETCFPDLRYTLHKNEPISQRVTDDWIYKEYIPRVQNRSKEIVQLRRLGGAASTAHAVIEHVRDWCYGSELWHSVGLKTTGREYGVPKDLFFAFPCTSIPHRNIIVDSVCVIDPKI